MRTLKEKLADTNLRVSTVFCTIPSAIVTQAIATSGIDSIIVDFEHGAIDYASAHAMIAATAGTECAPLVRVAKNDKIDVKRALDMGAEGIVFPMIRDAKDATSAVASLRYPPRGTRGFGPFIAQSRWQTSVQEYQDVIEPRLICALLIETVEAVENIEAICAIEGVDIIILAAFDLSAALGVAGKYDHPDFLAAQKKIEATALKSDLPLAGNGSNMEQAKSLFSKGYRIIGSFDIIWLKSKAAEFGNWCR